MSVALVVEWVEGEGTEEYLWAFQSQVEELWPAIALKHGLEFLNGKLPVFITPEDLSTIEREFNIVREEISARLGNSESERTAFKVKYDKIAYAFHRMANSHGWHAIIG